MQNPQESTDNNAIRELNKSIQHFDKTTEKYSKFLLVFTTLLLFVGLMQLLVTIFPPVSLRERISIAIAIALGFGGFTYRIGTDIFRDRR